MHASGAIGHMRATSASKSVGEVVDASKEAVSKRVGDVVGAGEEAVVAAAVDGGSIDAAVLEEMGKSMRGVMDAERNAVDAGDPGKAAIVDAAVDGGSIDAGDLEDINASVGDAAVDNADVAGGIKASVGEASIDADGVVEDTGKNMGGAMDAVHDVDNAVTLEGVASVRNASGDTTAVESVGKCVGEMMDAVHDAAGDSAGVLEDMGASVAEGIKGLAEGMHMNQSVAEGIAELNASFGQAMEAFHATLGETLFNKSSKELQWNASVREVLGNITNTSLGIEGAQMEDPTMQYVSMALGWLEVGGIFVGKAGYTAVVTGYVWASRIGLGFVLGLVLYGLIMAAVVFGVNSQLTKMKLRPL